MIGGARAASRHNQHWQFSLPATGTGANYTVAAGIVSYMEDGLYTFVPHTDSFGAPTTADWGAGPVQVIEEDTLTAPLAGELRTNVTALFRYKNGVMNHINPYRPSTVGGPVATCCPVISPNAPTDPFDAMIWWNSAGDPWVEYYYLNGQWVPSGSAWPVGSSAITFPSTQETFEQGLQPSNPTGGDVWYNDSVNPSEKLVYLNGGWRSTGEYYDAVSDTYIFPAPTIPPVPVATTTVSGTIEIASQVEVDACADNTRAVTPLTLCNYVAAQIATALTTINHPLETSEGSTPHANPGGGNIFINDTTNPWSIFWYLDGAWQNTGITFDPVSNVFNFPGSTGGGWTPIPATETQQGIAEIATNAEALTALDDTRIMTPLKTKALINDCLSNTSVNPWMSVGPTAPNPVPSDPHIWWDTSDPTRHVQMHYVNGVWYGCGFQFDPTGSNGTQLILDGGTS